MYSKQGEFACMLKSVCVCVCMYMYDVLVEIELGFVWMSTRIVAVDSIVILRLIH